MGANETKVVNAPIPDLNSIEDTTDKIQLSIQTGDGEMKILLGMPDPSQGNGSIDITISSGGLVVTECECNKE